MPGRETLRLFAFRSSGPSVDVLLREAVTPELAARPGIVDLFVGRQGGDLGDRRVIASIVTADAPAVADEAAALAQHAGPEVTLDSQLEVASVQFAVRRERATPASILRVFHGRVSDGHWEAYLEASRRGTVVDAALNEGLVALYLGVTEPPSFITVSAWSDWASIERATGGNISRPFATQHSELLAEKRAEHYEVAPDIPRPPAPADDAT